MNKTEAKAIIQRAAAHMDERSTDMAIKALQSADLAHGQFRTALASAQWQLHTGSGTPAWQATLTTNSTQVQAEFDTEEKAIVWLANRLGAIIWAYDYATRNHAEVVIPAKPQTAD